MATSLPSRAQRRSQASSALGLYASFNLGSALVYCVSLLFSRRPSETGPDRAPMLRTAGPVSADI